MPETEGSNDIPAQQEESNPGKIFVIIGIGAAVLLLIGVVVVIMVKKKK